MGSNKVFSVAGQFSISSACGSDRRVLISQILFLVVFVLNVNRLCLRPPVLVCVLFFISMCPGGIEQSSWSLVPSKVANIDCAPSKVPDNVDGKPVASFAVTEFSRDGKYDEDMKISVAHHRSWLYVSGRVANVDGVPSKVFDDADGKSFARLHLQSLAVMGIMLKIRKP